MPQLEKIFATIAERYDASAMPGFSTKVQFDLEDSFYFIAIEDGKCNYGTEKTENPDATVTMTQEDFKAMVSGELNPMMAFMQGKIKVDGNMSTVMKLQTMLTA